MLRILALLLLSVAASFADTNAPARPALNQHQLFYTNWTRQYFAIRAVVGTNINIIARQQSLVNAFGGENSPARQQRQEQLDAASKAAAPSLQRLNSVVQARLKYEAAYPAATAFAPQIRNWRDTPKPDFKE